MDQKRPRTGLIVLISASIMAAVLGSIHAFSVFLAPLEAEFGVTRSQVSLTYSLALVTLTIAVMIGPKVFSRWSAHMVMFRVGTLAAGGAFLAGHAPSFSIILIGYSLIFGAANGLGYGFGLQIAAKYNSSREGLAMGIVTAAYALGAVVSSPLFSLALNRGGFSVAMFALAAVLLTSGVLCAGLMRSRGVRLDSDTHAFRRVSSAKRSLSLLWLGYFGGVLAGLMIIGHAAAVSEALRPDLHTWIAPMIIATFNVVGSLGVGRLSDRFSPRILMSALGVLTVFALAGIAVNGRIFGLLFGLAAVGFAYGGTITVYPAAILKLFGRQESPRVYGLVFTAWGLAGLTGPWLAGRLFDLNGSYTLALLVAACFACLSAATVIILFRDKSLRREPKVDG